MTTLSFPASVTFAKATALLATLRNQLARPVTATPLVVQIDVSALQQFDSSVLAVLLELQRSMAPCSLNIVKPPANLLALLKVYGAEELFDIAPNGDAE
jgi:phospholipid transport system transporter-binding protein